MVDFRSSINRFYEILKNYGGSKEVIETLEDHFFSDLYLNGDKEKMSESGVYFSGKSLAKDLVEFSGIDFKEMKVIYDPACGAGDLLGASIENWRVSESLSKTLKAWEGFIYGSDINKDFVLAAKLRIVLVAIKLGARIDFNLREIEKKYLRNIVLEDSFNSDRGFKVADIVIMNPPFHASEAEGSSIYKKGKVNSAAFFLERAADKTKEDCSLIAILPDVIRSGTRYGPVRALVNAKWGGELLSRGRFNRFADVDVFFMHGSPLVPKGVFWEPERSAKVVDDICSVNVGSVVPHRHLEEGTEVAFVCAKTTRVGQIKKRIVTKRRFEGRLFYPPFVVVRRTSSPRDKLRAASSVILGDRPVAVENHLLVVKPKSNSSEECIKIMNYFHSSLVNRYLNEVICCRHLTVNSIKNIPLDEL